MNISKKDINDAHKSIKELDIWFENGNIDGHKFTMILSKMLKDNEFAKFEMTCSKVKQSPFGHKVERRITCHLSIYDNLKTILNVDDNLNTKIILQEYCSDKKRIESLHDIFDKESGLYYIHNPGLQYDYFDEDFISYDKKIKQILIERGFKRTLYQNSQARFRIIIGARFHNFNHNFYAVSDENGFYDSSNSARLARLNNCNYFSSNIEKSIEKAIILPIDYICDNFYHNLCETMAGLRYINQLPDDIPIIYTEDRFHILDFIASRLCIERSRFISIKNLSNTVIKKALHLYAGSYTWDAAMYSFFSKVSYPQTIDLKIYISRRKSSRGPSNELEIEKKLESQGFRVIYPEDISFAEQVEIFSNANIVISPHGAGLSHIAFTPPKCSLIEIFRSGSIQPDYYLRSRHRRIHYHPLIQHGEKLDINSIKEVLAYISKNNKI
ncbi:glycosyltransferase family 61 protein [Pantoea sp. NPDC088449]|uniref:glycosyltransferase family 61 protein n=1 Tax=Pantoea sp. NPDC088449 TaxID=3364392 RepID=UPI00380EE97B